MPLFIIFALLLPQLIAMTAEGNPSLSPRLEELVSLFIPALWLWELQPLITMLVSYMFGLVAQVLLLPLVLLPRPPVSHYLVPQVVDSGRVCPFFSRPSLSGLQARIMCLSTTIASLELLLAMTPRDQL